MKLTASFGGFVVAGLVGALLLPVSIALAQQADPVAGNVLERRVIDTDDLGVNGPTGLVIDRGSDTIYVIGEDPTSLAGFTPAGNDAGTIVLAIALDPLNTAFDSSTQTLVTITSDGVIRVPLDGGPTTVIGTPNLAQPSGLTLDEASGEIFVLEAGGSRVTRIDPAGGTERFSLDAPSGLAGIAHNPVDSLLYVGVPAQQSIRSFDMAGAAVATFDVSPAGLVNPGAMAFSRSTDPTDAAADTTILVLDAAHVSNGGSAGRLVELSLGPPAPDAGPLALADHTVAVLENTINAWTFNPPSPDSAGITFFEHTGNLFMSDSEVNEMTIFQNVNLWELTLSGGQVNTGVTVPWSSEPTGVSYNPDPDPTTGRHRLYVSQDDGGGVIFDVDPVDSIYGNGDDVILQTDAGALGIGDVEGLAFDRTSGNIFVSDGVASEVYEVDPGPDGDFDGVDDSLVGPSFDIGGFGAGDPEGIVHNHFDDTLLIVDDPSASVYEVTKTGTLVRTIDISAAPLVKAAGITLAPASDGSPAWHMYIADRGIDNGADPFENDGRIFEMSLDFGPVGNPPVAVDDADSTIEDTPVVIDVAANDSDPDGDLDPSTAVPSTQPGSGLAAGNGDGTITYTPDPDTNGADSFTYRICDLGGACDSATVDVTVAPVDDPPVAVDDSAATAEDTAVVIDVAANDTDPDNNLDPTTAAPAAQPANGTAAGNGDGTITYTPNGGFSGTDTFEYQICDTTAPTPLCDTATTTIDVGPAPTGAEFRSHTTASTEDATFLTIPKPSGVVAGDVLVAFLMNSQNGSISWTPPPGWVQIGTEQATGAYAATAWYLVAQGTEPADFTWSMGANNETVGAIFAIAGADTANPIAAQQAVSDGLPSAISVTTSVDDALLILWGAQDAVSPQTWSNPDGMVEHFDETVTTTELTHGGYTGPSGPAGVHTRTIDGTAGSSPLGWLVAITPDT